MKITLEKIIFFFALLSVSVFLIIKYWKKILNFFGPKKYTCDGKTCKEDPDGEYSDEGCSGKCPTSSGGGYNGIPIENQSVSSMQLVNDTNENFLHVMIECKDKTQTFKILDKSGDDAVIYPPVAWLDDKSWDPLGSKILAEAIIPKNGYIIFSIDGLSTFTMAALKMVTDNNVPLSIDDAENKCDPPSDDIGGQTLCKVLFQTPLLFEGAKNAVADISGVDGINFRVRYSLTTSPGGEVKTMEIKKNPCQNIDQKYHRGVGCWSPIKVDCGNTSSATCKVMEPGNISTQNCKFNNCSQNLFNISQNLIKYIDKYDGAGGPNSPYNNWSDYPEVVKPFINDSSNLKDNSDQKNYCDDMQFEQDNFTTYCYDYNDNDSSKTLADPYKAKIVFMDLS